MSDHLVLRTHGLSLNVPAAQQDLIGLDLDQMPLSRWVDEKRDLAGCERQKPRSAKIGAIKLSTGA